MEMSEKIIVIDDNPEIREVVNVLLSSEGYTILEAKNAEEALEQEWMGINYVRNCVK